MFGESQPAWLSEGIGPAPRLQFRCRLDGGLAGMDCAREEGSLFAADNSGGVYRYDRRGSLTAVTRGQDGVRALSVSDDGSAVVCLIGPSRLAMLTGELQSRWQLDFHEQCLAAAVAAYGNYVVIAFANAENLVVDCNRQQISQFTSIRPLGHISFVVESPDIVGAAEHALLCRYSLKGKPEWDSSLGSNVGSLAVTADGRRIFLAGYNQGIQTYNGEGTAKKSFVVDGTVKCLAASASGKRIIAATVEGHLYWLDSDGEIVWTTGNVPDVVKVCCDPLGDWFVVGMQDGTVARCGWAELSPTA